MVKHKNFIVLENCKETLEGGKRMLKCELTGEKNLKREDVIQIQDE